MTDVIEYDGLTGETIERSYTDEEAAQRAADAETEAAMKAAAAEAEAARVQAVQESQAELKAMGLSDTTIATISGYPYPYSPAV